MALVGLTGRGSPDAPDVTVTADAAFFDIYQWYSSDPNIEPKAEIIGMIPEPATFGYAAMAGALLLLRRRSAGQPKAPVS
jgi:hypothetical protein